MNKLSSNIEITPVGLQGFFLLLNWYLNFDTEKTFALILN